MSGRPRPGRECGQPFGGAFDVSGWAGVGHAIAVPQQNSPVRPYGQIGAYGDDTEDGACSAVDPSYAALAKHLVKRADHTARTHADGAGGSGQEPDRRMHRCLRSRQQAGGKIVSRWSVG